MEITPEQELAQRVLDYLEQNPEVHNQDQWFLENSEVNECGTVMCVAGASALLAEGIESARVCRGSGWVSYGAALLGLDRGEANDFFFMEDDSEALDALRALANNDRTKFRSIVKAYYREE